MTQNAINIAFLNSFTMNRKPLKFLEGVATMLDINEIKIIPHRYPFLLIDQIVELEEEKRAVGIKMSR